MPEPAKAWATEWENWMKESQTQYRQFVSDNYDRLKTLMNTAG